MANKDGMAKNMEVVLGELKAWRSEMAIGFYRLKGSSFRMDNTNVFHVLTNFIEETYDKLPRTLTYLTIVSVLSYGVACVVASFPV